VTPEQFQDLIKAIHFLAGAVVFHAIAAGPSTSGISSALRDIAREIKDRK
jgi:hypothetical protein